LFIPISGMNEFFTQAIVWHNLPLTLLMGATVVYWLLSLLGTVDLDLDFDFDLDTDADLETSDVSAGHNALGAVLKFINAQDVPIMMVLSLVTLFMWVFTIYANYYLNPGQNGWIALGIGVGTFVVSTLCVKGITQPLRPFFRALKKDEESNVPLIGSIGTVKSRVMDTTYGQVVVEREKGAPALLNAFLDEGALVRGDTVIILSFDEEKRRYLTKAAPELTTPAIETSS